MAWNSTSSPARLILAGILVVGFSIGGSMAASFGVALSRADEGLDHLLGRADNALYAAKHAGRNRLAIAG